MEIPAHKQRKNEYDGEDQFLNLSTEIILYIFSFLESQQLCRVQQCSKEMALFASDELTWKNLCVFDWGINAPFAQTWKQSYAALEELCADGVWEGMSKWIEPAGFDNEQKTTARLHFVKRSKYAQTPQPIKASPSVLKRVDSQTTNPPVVRSDSSSADQHRNAPHRIAGSGVTVNCATPSPFKIEGERTISDVTGSTFEWNKHFEKHTSVYKGQMDFGARSVSGTIDYNDGNTHWKGVFSYTKQNKRSTKLVMA